MPIRKNFAQRLDTLASPDEDDSDAADWCFGQAWGVSLRTGANSSEQLACGVVVRLDGPGDQIVYLYDFASLTKLIPTYGKVKVARWEELIKRTRNALDQGNEESPAPTVIIYGSKTPWRYETAELALERLWLTHVSFFATPGSEAAETEAHADADKKRA